LYEGELRPISYEPEIDDDNFDVALIADQLDAERVEELEDGDDPTDDELELWREVAMEQAVAKQEAEDEYNFQAVRIWGVGDDERVMFFYTLHSEGGELDDDGGPFETMDKLRAVLNTEGDLSL
jgi:hypothetical protein